MRIVARVDVPVLSERVVDGADVAVLSDLGSTSPAGGYVMDTVWTAGDTVKPPPLPVHWLLLHAQPS